MPGPVVGEDDLDAVALERGADPDPLRVAGDLLERVAGVRQQVDEDLLELDRVAEHDQLLGAEVELDLDRAQAELLLHQRQRALDHLVDVHALERDRTRRGRTCAGAR